MYLRSASASLFTSTHFPLPMTAIIAVLLSTVSVCAQNASPEPVDPQNPQAQAQPKTLTLPAGTQVALVLTHPIQSRYIHRGDDIYAQVTSPVVSGDQMVIPPGTFVQGTVDKLGRQGDRGELHLQSMSIAFAGGYVAPISGPVTIETNQGYALKDPGTKSVLSSALLPIGGAALGTVIGYAVGQSDSSTTSAFPPGCVGPPPFCTTVNTPVFGTRGRDAVIGGAVGGVLGFVASMTVLGRSHHFYIDAGAPIEMTLNHDVELDRKAVDAAVEQSAQPPVAQQPVLPRPVPPSVPDFPVNHSTCFTPGTPGTPPTVIPGTPGPDGIPGPPTVIPGTPPTPGTPYPCP